MKNLLSILFLSLLVFSCDRPASTEEFIRGKGPFRFTVDMQDSTAAYSFDLCTRIDARDVPAQLQLDITWKMPGDSLFQETVYLPINRQTSFFSHEAYAPYREDIVPAEWGIWELVITVPEQPEGFRGMGLVTKRKWATEN